MSMKKKIFYVLGVVMSIAIIVFGYYTLSPLFITIRVDEALPEERRVESNSVAKSQAQIVPSPVMGTAGHPASGTARRIETDGKWYIRYENFKTINGPDIYVYLAKDLEAKGYVSLGKVKATEGNVNYEVPQNVDPTEYRYVMVWCKQFGVLFNYADLSHNN